MIKQCDENLRDVENTIYVCWIDARSEDGWTTIDDLDYRPADIITVGQLVKETAELVCIAGSLDQRTGQVASIMYIPKVCITARGPIRRVEDDQP